jgi:hypothetical protein
VLLQLFCSGLDIEAALYLNTTIKGSFAHKPTTEQRKFLDHILAKHTSSIVETKPFLAKAMLSAEESSLAKSKPIASLDSTHEPSPEPQTPKDRIIHPSEFPIKFKD